MKYETPQIVELTQAIGAIQDCKCLNAGDISLDANPAYEDWE
jgi:hypothetical protein